MAIAIKSDFLFVGVLPWNDLGLMKVSWATHGQQTVALYYKSCRAGRNLTLVIFIRAQLDLIKTKSVGFFQI